MARVLQAPFELSPDIIDEVVRCITEGGILSVATETYYALAVGAMQSQAVERVGAIKGRHDQKPILVLIGDRTQLSHLVSAVPPSANFLMDRFWPGPLSLVFPAAPHLPHELTCRTGTIGVRQPAEPRLLALLRETGPLTGTSANRSGAKPAQTAEEVQREFDKDIELILDCGPSPGGLPSTLLSVVNGLRILRSGPISESVITTVLAEAGLSLTA